MAERQPPKEADNSYQCLLRDLSKMAEPALVVYLRDQIIIFNDALKLQGGGNFFSSAKRDVFEKYGLNPALSDVLFDNNPDGIISASTSKFGTLTVSGQDKADILLIPGPLSFLNLDLRYENEYSIRLSSCLGRGKALEVIGSPVLSKADAFLTRIWRLNAPEGITEEYRNAQALIWSVEQLAHEQGLLKAPLHPHYDRDILTVRK